MQAKGYSFLNPGSARKQEKLLPPPGASPGLDPRPTFTQERCKTLPGKVFRSYGK
jgi:hypothetical protein